MFVPGLRKHGMKFSPNEGGGSGSGDQASSGASGQESQSNSQQAAAGAGEGGQASSAKAKTPEEYEKMIADLRTENATHRTKNKDLEKFKAGEEAKSLSETDRLKKQATDAETKAATAAERVLKSEIKLAARNANIVDPDAAVALLDKSKIKLDADGEPTNLAELMTELVSSKAYLLAPTGGTGHSPSNPGAQGRGGTLTLAQLKTMTAAQVAALPEAEVNRVLAAGR